MLPQYMDDVKLREDEYIYGKLYYDRDGDSWIIEGEPMLCQMAKRLFPGSSGRGQGEVRFKAGKRLVGDLNWLMMRFPLEIVDRVEWEREIGLARDYVEKKESITKQPVKMTPNGQFKGELLEFQKEAVSYLHYNSPTLLADEMGLGKTVTALAWVDTLKVEGKRKGIVVLPKNIQNQWKKSIMTFMGLGDTDIHILSGLKPYELPDAEFYIIHYGLLRGWKRVLPEQNFDFLIFDEIQELRHTGTEKYSSASLLSDSVENKIGLSGTPIYNAGGEIWNILNILEYHCIGDWDSFTREWCYGYGSDSVRNPEMLGDYLKREGLMIRRRKEDVLEELPDKRRIMYDIEGDNKIFNENIEKALKLVKELEGATNPLEKGRLSRWIGMETRLATGLSKAKEVAEFVKMLLDSGEKVVLFGWHHEVYAEWLNYLSSYNPAFITGKQSEKEKLAGVKRFRKGGTNLIILSLRAAAGMDGLQEVASVNVFGELDWSPGVHNQCEDRLHRLGQKDSVLSYYMINSLGMDMDMIEALGFKSSQFVGIMGDRVEGQEDKILAETKVSEHMQKVIARLKELNN